MRFFPWIRSLLANLFGTEKVERRLQSELESYVEMVTDEKIAAGFTASEARRTALAEFGGLEQVRQEVRNRRAGASVEIILRDLRYGWRQLLRNPGFTAAVIVTLALSIGANTAIFSIVNALMLKSLPYPSPDRIGTIFWHIEGTQPFDGLSDIDGEQWELLRDNVPSLFGAVSSSISSGANLRAGQSIQYVREGRVSARYFEALGIRPYIGRTFTENEDRPHGAKAVILSYGLWRTTFHADAHLIGQAIDLKGEPYTVVGVLPAAAKTPLNTDLYIDLQPTRTGKAQAQTTASWCACATAPTGARPTPRSTRPGLRRRAVSPMIFIAAQGLLLHRPVAERANSRPSPQSAFAHVCRLVDPAHRMCQSRRAHRRPHGAAHA